MKSAKIVDDKNVEILVAEDSPTQAEQLRNLLEEAGYKVRAAANGQEALAAARNHKPTLIISDIVMPEMDGYAFCKEIKSKKKLEDIPVVLLTQLSSPEDVIKGLQCGADNFIRKPYDPKYLLSRIEYILTNRRLRGTEKVHMGLEIYLSGQRHFITSERQQILDLLVSTYEEAVCLNEELKVKQKDLARSYQSLNGLYFIAEGLNKCTNVQEVSEKALERSMQLPGVRAGWIVLREGEVGFRVQAVRNLPPVLERPGAMEGDCFCRQQLLSGELDHAANIMECERLQTAEGERYGLRYHASIPLRADSRTLGIMNLAATDEERFSEEDLKLLYGVGNQIAVALERAQLYESLEQKVQERTAALRSEVVERKRAQEEVQRNLERIRALHEIDVAISSSLDLRAVLDVLLEKTELFLRYSAATIRLWNERTGLLEPVACRNINEEEWKADQWKGGRGSPNTVFETRATVHIGNCQTDARVRDHEFFRKNSLVSYLGAPLIAHDKVLGVISFYTREEREFTDDEIGFSTTLAGQAAIAIHNAQLYEQMARANKVKDEFLSVMSHELRTPLNVVVGYTGMIMDGMLGEVNDRQKEAMEKVINRTNDQLAMVNNILYATVLDTEKINVESHPLVLGDFFKQLSSTYEIPLNKQLSFNWDCPSPLAVIHTDSAKLRHILHNLIDNALKFTAKGSVTIKAGIRQQEEEGNRQLQEERQQEEEPLTPHASRLTPTWVEFRVSDTGVGIPKEYLPFVFDKFRQVDSSETRSFGGVGMGLYIVKKFTELLGGKVDVESEPGKGSTFTVTIPCKS